MSQDQEDIRKQEFIDHTDDDINLGEIWSIIRRAKYPIIILTSIFALGSIYYALSLPNMWKSETILVSRQENQPSSMMSQYSGLAALVGVRLPGSSDSSGEVLEIIRSREFVKHLITFDGVLPGLMAAKSYDFATGELSYSNIYDPESKKWKREPGVIKKAKPSYIEAHEVYEGILGISSSAVGFTSISIEHVSPIFAKDFLSLIIKQANDLKRKKDIEKSAEALAYLKAELANTALVEIKESINQLIESQLEIQMVARINEEYSLIILEPPFIPEKKSAPNRQNIVIISTLLGGFLGVGLAFVLHYFQFSLTQLTTGQFKRLLDSMRNN